MDLCVRVHAQPSAWYERKLRLEAFSHTDRDDVIATWRCMYIAKTCHSVGQCMHLCNRSGCSHAQPQHACMRADCPRPMLTMPRCLRCPPGCTGACCAADMVCCLFVQRSTTRRPSWAPACWGCRTRWRTSHGPAASWSCACPGAPPCTHYGRCDARKVAVL